MQTEIGAASSESADLLSVRHALTPKTGTGSGTSSKLSPGERRPSRHSRDLPRAEFDGHLVEAVLGVLWEGSADPREEDIAELLVLVGLEDKKLGLAISGAQPWKESVGQVDVVGDADEDQRR
eukprot:CAMPEP_0114526294 /NCGR_PEP_ID=MMETSP0109-20121206/22937_1 /TAXON_ID=29199 /ORGANISM="Chlorarachnion reptans, Strain CCCM449" /LENGTH=122 /DNA_ID=CAMNT_0001708045 /DNA_START=243 /DNA_END=611 /DNA_ORIENTATION=-